MEEEIQIHSQSKDDNNFNDINSLSYNGLLDKLQTLKEYKESNTIIEKKVVLIKTTNDSEIQSLINFIMGNPKNSPVIGLRKVLCFLQKEKTVSKIELYEYNYLVSKKFSYLKNQSIADSQILLFVLNIFDKKSVENLKKIFEDISQNQSLKFQGKIIKFLIIKSTDNFLLKLSEDTYIKNIKKDLEELTKSYNINTEQIEIEIDELKEVNEILKMIIK